MIRKLNILYEKKFINLLFYDFKLEIVSIVYIS